MSRINWKADLVFEREKLGHRKNEVTLAEVQLKRAQAIKGRGRGDRITSADYVLREARREESIQREKVGMLERRIALVSGENGEALAELFERVETIERSLEKIGEVVKF